MKRCTYCGTEHSDEETICSVDQQPLPASSPSAEEATEPDRTWITQLVLPAVLWLIANILLAGLFTICGSMLLVFGTALWAAKDCSKMHPHASRVLGIAFKPVVVFSAIAFLPFLVFGVFVSFAVMVFGAFGAFAFFLWECGFVWYLILRRCVMRTSNLGNQRSGEYKSAGTMA